MFIRSSNELDNQFNAKQKLLEKSKNLLNEIKQVLKAIKTDNCFI